MTERVQKSSRPMPPFRVNIFFVNACSKLLKGTRASSNALVWSRGLVQGACLPPGLASTREKDRAKVPALDMQTFAGISSVV